MGGKGGASSRHVCSPGVEVVRSPSPFSCVSAVQAESSSDREGPRVKKEGDEARDWRVDARITVIIKFYEFSKDKKHTESWCCHTFCQSLNGYKLCNGQFGNI